ncbi:MAG: branched-chain amino acid ABC transporter permease [Thermodesulfobacteriota bacterium]
MNGAAGHLRPLWLLAAAGLILSVLPWVVSPYVLVWIFLLCVYLTLAASYDIVGGYMGYMNLGHSTFFGLGAYGTAILLNHGYGLPMAAAGGVIVSICFAALVSYPLFRLRGAYFALGTFGMISLVEVLINNLRNLTGGSGGISTPPGDNTVPAYYLSVLIVAATLTFSYLISRSRFGLALFSIREDEEVARSLGVPTSLYKALALVFSAIPASLVGGVYVWCVTYISPPAAFGLEIALSPIVMAMLGGTGTLLGPFLGALFLTSLQELLWTKMPYLHLTIYGGILVTIGLFMPGGIVRARWFRPVLDALGVGEKMRYLDL